MNQRLLEKLRASPTPLQHPTSLSQCGMTTITSAGLGYYLSFPARLVAGEEVLLMYVFFIEAGTGVSR